MTRSTTPLTRPSSRRHTQRGLTLVEALVGFLVLSIGFLGTTRLQSWLRLDVDISRQRTEAIGMALQQLERLRATASPQGYADIADTREEKTGANTGFHLSQQVHGEAGWKAMAVTVAWADRSGQARSVSFDTGIGGTAPVYSALLTVPSQDQSLAPPQRMPWGARPFGQGQAIFKPDAQGTRAWLLDAGTGAVTSICTVSAEAALDGLDPAALTDCEAVSGSLLAGHVRFSLGDTPDAEHPGDAPLPLAVALALDPVAATPPRCETDAHAGTRTDTHEPFTAYACVVPIAGAAAGWSGRFGIEPEGWTLGLASTDFKVCRYSADHDGSGRIDRNDEHPAAYTAVTGPLLQQNYLVVRGDRACPAALQTHNAVSVATVPHQP